MGSGGTSGMVTDDWETFRMYNMESEIVGGTCRVKLLAREVSKCLSATLTGGVINHHLAGQACMSGVCAAGFCIIVQVPVTDKTDVCLSFKTRTSICCGKERRFQRRLGANNFVFMEIRPM